MKVRVTVQAGRRGVAGEARRVLHSSVVEGAPGARDELAVGFDPRDFRGDEMGEVTFEILPDRPPEPTQEEGDRIHAAHDAVASAYGERANWGTRAETMGTVWDRALAAGVVSREDFELVRRDSGKLWELRGDPVI